MAAVASRRRPPQGFPGHTPEGDGHNVVWGQLDGTWEQGVRIWEMHPLMRRITDSSEEAARLSWTADQTQEDGTQVRPNQLRDSHQDITDRLGLTNLDDEEMNQAVKSFREHRAAGLGLAPLGDIFNADHPVVDAESVSDTWGAQDDWEDSQDDWKSSALGLLPPPPPPPRRDLSRPGILLASCVCVLSAYRRSHDYGPPHVQRRPEVCQPCKCQPCEC